MAFMTDIGNINHHSMSSKI